MVCLAASTLNYFAISFNAEALEEGSGGDEGVAAPSMAGYGSACTKNCKIKSMLNMLFQKRRLINVYETEIAAGMTANTPHWRTLEPPKAMTTVSQSVRRNILNGK